MPGYANAAGLRPTLPTKLIWYPKETHTHTPQDAGLIIKILRGTRNLRYRTVGTKSLGRESLDGVCFANRKNWSLVRRINPQLNRQKAKNFFYYIKMPCCAD